MSEILIEANLTLNVAYLKYKDREDMMTGEKISKRERLVEEFKGEVLQYWLNKRGVYIDEFN